MDDLKWVDVNPFHQVSPSITIITLSPIGMFNFLCGVVTNLEITLPLSHLFHSFRRKDDLFGPRSQWKKATSINHPLCSFLLQYNQCDLINEQSWCSFHVIVMNLWCYHAQFYSLTFLWIPILCILSEYANPFCVIQIQHQIIKTYGCFIVQFWGINLNKWLRFLSGGLE